MHRAPLYSVKPGSFKYTIKLLDFIIVYATTSHVFKEALAANVYQIQNVPNQWLSVDAQDDDVSCRRKDFSRLVSLLRTRLLHYNQ
jgi:DNA topoisomerase IB